MKFDTLIRAIGRLHNDAQRAAGHGLNQIMSFRNWLVGALIVEYEQGGEDRAAYGQGLIAELAGLLRQAEVRGFSPANLKNCRQVALAYPGLDLWRFQQSAPIAAPLLESLSSSTGDEGETSGELKPEARTGDGIRQTSGESPSASLRSVVSTLFPSLRARARAGQGVVDWRDADWVTRLFRVLTFSHLLEMSRIDDELQRGFYEVHCLKERWSVRNLKRQRGSLLFERTGLSTDKAGLLELAREQVGTATSEAVLRDPYVLEFLELGAVPRFTESDLEQALLDHLQSFLLELGSDFCFVGRQFRITTASGHHYLDLLFFHRGLRCLVAIDLKVEPFRHEHAGQMNFYVNFLADQVTREDENPPIGVILCTDKDAAEVRYATAGIERAVFVSRYLAQLPSFLKKRCQVCGSCGSVPYRHSTNESDTLFLFGRLTYRPPPPTCRSTRWERFAEVASCGGCDISRSASLPFAV